MRKQPSGIKVTFLSGVEFKAAGWNFEVVLVLAASLDNSGMTNTAWCRKALDPAACYHVPLFWKRVREQDTKLL